VIPSAIIFLLLLAPATAPDAPVFVILTHEGRLVRGEGGAVGSIRGLETIASSPSDDGLVATRGQEILLLPLARNNEPRLLLKHSTHVRFAELSPDGEFLTFSGSVTDAPEIFLATRDANGEFIRPRSIARGFGPSFSHHGRVIYFERGENGLAQFDTHTGVTTEFLPDYRRAHSVRCARDGKWIAFSMNRAMYLYRTSDNTVRQLSDGRSYDRFASFVGEEVLFFRETRDGEQQVVAIRTDRSNERVLYRGDVMLVIGLPPKP
jgi:Tol biopolymer transport system component